MPVSLTPASFFANAGISSTTTDIPAAISSVFEQHVAHEGAVPDDLSIAADDPALRAGAGESRNSTTA